LTPAVPAGGGIVERFDNIWSVAFRYVKSVIWMSVIATLLIMLGTYLLFRQLVYQPVDRLLAAMSRAKAGDLETHVPQILRRAWITDQEFNSMISQVRGITREREAQQSMLREKVSEATIELEQRNQQLRETNLELWRTTRRMNELGRLRRRQTAAHFAMKLEPH